MRKKLLFGTIALLALVAVAGERYFNRAVGQDIPLPKAPEADKNDLFNQLKKDLESSVQAPSVPATKKDDVPAAPMLPALPSAKKDETAPPMLPALPMAKKDDAAIPTFPAPTSTGEKTQAPPPSLPSSSVVPKPTEAPLVDKVPANNTPASKPDDKKEPTIPPLAPLKQDADLKPATNVTEKKAETYSIQLPPPAGTEPAKLDPIKPEAKAPAVQPMQPTTAPQAVALPKNSPWSLSVVLVDGQTILTAVVNKKHEFKILCQTLDLQTGKGSLKASGKVQINGDALNGTCEHLSISLLDDRLLLEGKALVTIDRTSANVSDTAPASFELKGETLNLRISELQSTATPERTVDAQRVSRSDTPSRVVTASMKLEGTQWTPYGRLRAMKSSDNMWSLEGSNGTVIAYLLAREGGTLERYVGQNISVYGTREREQSGQPVLRVTHIALP